MSIDIKIGDKENESSTKIKMQIRKALDGSLIINDHEDIDIIIIPDKNKIIVFSTDQKNSDKNYDSFNRFFKYMTKKGVIDYPSVHAGNVYASMEGKILKSKNTDINAIDVALLVIGKFIEEERPNFLYVEKIKSDYVEDETNPDDYDSTELGKVPHAASKGSNERSPSTSTYFPRGVY